MKVFSGVSSLTAGQYRVIGTCTAGATCTAVTPQAACVDLSALGSNYLATIPMDPKTGAATDTDYYLMKDSNGAITVGACEPEGDDAGGGGAIPVIKVTR